MCPDKDVNKFFSLSKEIREKYFPERYDVTLLSHCAGFVNHCFCLLFHDRIKKRTARTFRLIGEEHVMLREPTAEILGWMKGQYNRLLDYPFLSHHLQIGRVIPANQTTVLLDSSWTERVGLEKGTDGVSVGSASM